MKIKRPSKMFWLIILTFLMPIFLAKLFLFQGWFEKGYTNKGVFFEQHITYQKVRMRNPMMGLWQIAYVLPKTCDDACFSQLALMRNSWMALGRKQERVSLVVLTHPEQKEAIQQQVENPDLYIWTEVSEDFLQRFQAKQLMIIDPLGKFVLKYEGAGKVTQQEQIAENRDLMLDLRKLLTFSKGG